MAKKQTRRSISFSRADFELAQAAAQRAKVPLAQLAAEALHEYLERRSARDEAIGRAARTPFTVADVKQAVVGLHEIKPGDDGMINIPIDPVSPLDHALREDPKTDPEVAEEVPATKDVQVMYDEDFQARKQAAQRRRR